MSKSEATGWEKVWRAFDKWTDRDIRTWEQQQAKIMKLADAYVPRGTLPAKVRKLVEEYERARSDTVSSAIDPALAIADALVRMVGRKS